jgi:hypothetical protein
MPMYFSKNLDYSLGTEQIWREKPAFISINEATPAFIKYFKKTFAKEYPHTFM